MSFNFKSLHLHIKNGLNKKFNLEDSVQYLDNAEQKIFK